MGAAAFWLLAAWLITVGLSSIIPQIFWPAGRQTAKAGSCGSALRQLERELLGQFAGTMTTAPRSDARGELDDWLSRWDKRLAAVRPSCTAHESAAWDELSRLRFGMRGLVDHFDREQAPRLRKLDTLLGPDTDAHAPR